MHIVKIHIIAKSDLGSYIYYVPRDEIEDILSGKHVALGIDDEDGLPIGAIITQTATEPDGGAREILVSRNMYISEKYRSDQVIRRVMFLLTDYARSKGLSGLVFEILHPDESQLEALLGRALERLKDGNTLYEAETAMFANSPYIRKDFGDLEKRIKGFESLSPTERESFFDKRRMNYPEGLDIKHLPGKWLPQFSFVCRDGEDITGYILSSEIAEDMLYVGALYVEKSKSLEPAALIGRFGRTVLKNTVYGRVMFAAATDEGKKLCEDLTRDIQGVLKREVHNYYIGA